MAGLARPLRAVTVALGYVALVAWILFALLVITLRYFVLPNVGHYRGDLERMASQATGETVRIGAIDASLRGLRPSLALRDIQVIDATGGRTLSLPSVHATLSWDSLAALQLRLASLEIDAPELTVRRDAEGQLFVAGYAIRKKAAPDNRAAEWLFAQDEIRVRGARLVWRDESVDPAAAHGALRDDLVLTDVAFVLQRSGRQHRIALRATPPVALAAPLDVRVALDHPLFGARAADPDTWSGEVYANLATGDVIAWRDWFPVPTTVESGHGRARVWMTFSNAATPAGSFARRLAARIKRPIPEALDRIASVTTDLALDDVALRWGAMADAPEYSALGAIDGRLEASQSTTAQRVAAVRMALQPRGAAKVAPTDFEMHRTVGEAPEDEVGSATLGAIDLAASLALVPEPVVPPAIVERVAALRPRGSVDGVTFKWTGPIASPTTFDGAATFARLAIAPQPPSPEAVAAAAREIVGANGLVRRPRPAFGPPGVTNLAGKVSASRARGEAGPVTRATLTIDGADVALVAPGLFDESTVRFAHVAADIGVRLEGPDLEVKVERGAFDNADLAGTIAMTLRHGPKSGGLGADGGRGWMDLDAKLSRAEVGRVPRYLPNIIGERARIYLRRSLVSGKVDEATLRMRGPIEKLNLRELPGALATPYPVSIPAALASVRDAKAGATARAVGEATPKDDETIFHALVKVHGATFRYGPGRQPDDPPPPSGIPPSPTSFIPWPAFEDVDADIVFDQARMIVKARSARVYDFRMTDITAELPALADPLHVLRVTGHGTGPMQDLVHFINEGPISRWLRGFTNPTRATGSAGLFLALDLPLTHPRDTEVAGSLQFAHNDLALNPIVPPLLGIDGRMDFSDRGLTMNDVTASALGGPLRIDAMTKSDGYIELNADGTLDIAAFQKSLHDRAEANASDGSPILTNAVDRAAPFVSGRAGYQVRMRVRSKRVTDLADNGAAPKIVTPGQPDLVVQSDLKGLAIMLPAPLAKEADATSPLRIELARTVSTDATTPDTEDIHASLGDQLAVEIARQRTPQGQLAVTRAAYRVGAGPSVRGGASTLTIDVPSLDVDAWREALKRATPPPATATPTTAVRTDDKLLPTRARLTSASLHAAGRTFTNVEVTAERGAAGWQADLASDQVAGRVSYTDVSGVAEGRTGVAPTSSGKLVARLSHLSIPPADGSTPRVEDTLDANRQRDFPAIDVIVDRFDLRGRTLGRLEVVAQNVETGAAREWRLDKLGLTTPEARFGATGVWGHGASKQTPEHTHLAFDLQASDVGALMDRFGLKNTISKGTATLTGNADWNGGPSTIDFASMSGSLKLAADKGQFLKAEPGVAKLLNILSLQGLARRLTLDFSDVFSPGFAFDTVRADAIVDHGIATTSDFTMRGVQATVTMVGSADLEHETTNLHVRVEPQINAGAASLGVAVINPAVGLATFVAQYLFRDRIANALSFEYNVSGPWARPDVVKIDRNGKATPVVPKAAPTAQGMNR